MQKRQKALIFDMDGLLIDSEPLWQQAEIEVFETVGISLTKTMTTETMGLRTDEVVKYWAEKFPEIPLNQGEIAEKIIERMQELIVTVGEAMPGAIATVQLCQKLQVPLALATSSSLNLVACVLQRLELTNVFEVIASAEKEPFGKPHPAVYLTASDRLGIAATNCIAFEDSLNGVISAKAARMKCIAVPALETQAEPGFALADVTLNSLEEITQLKLEEFLKL
ncbi:MAG: hexitol phosphatase HxpB [Oscillatoria sp. PMC 1068.18]|nr:hexitol phosphatase HxpB [Oscillatoria sp. PMC 1076.18]MEC4991667.1 hexitol phosphatase HxpB [Oscillatoria sp. PMC 1068.18]